MPKSSEEEVLLPEMGKGENKPAENYPAGNGRPIWAAKMVKFLQANLRRSRAAYDMALVVVRKHGVDILVVSEPNVKLVRGNSGWIRDKRTDVAVLIYNKKVKVRSLICEAGCVVVELEGGTRVLCTYISPNIMHSVFRVRIEEVMGLVAKSPGEVTVMGDLNCKAVDWGSPTTDARGMELCEWIAALDLTIHNDGVKPTCITPNGQSYVDLTLSTSGLTRRIRGWKVEDDLTLSDHQHIHFKLVVSGDRKRTREPPLGNLVYFVLEVMGCEFLCNLKIYNYYNI